MKVSCEDKVNGKPVGYKYSAYLNGHFVDTCIEASEEGCYVRVHLGEQLPNGGFHIKVLDENKNPLSVTMFGHVEIGYPEIVKNIKIKDEKIVKKYEP